MTEPISTERILEMSVQEWTEYKKKVEQAEKQLDAEIHKMRVGLPSNINETSALRDLVPYLRKQSANLFRAVGELKTRLETKDEQGLSAFHRSILGKKFCMIFAFIPDIRGQSEATYQIEKICPQSGRILLHSPATQTKTWVKESDILSMTEVEESPTAAELDQACEEAVTEHVKKHPIDPERNVTLEFSEELTEDKP